MIPSNGLDPTMSHPRPTRTNLERRYLRMSSAPKQATHTVLTRRERESPMACRVVTREAVGGSNYGFAHARVSRRMTRAIHDHQFAVWPSPGKFPCSDEWTSKVKASMDQDSRNVGQHTRLS